MIVLRDARGSQWLVTDLIIAILQNFLRNKRSRLCPSPKYTKPKSRSPKFQWSKPSKSNKAVVGPKNPRIKRLWGPKGPSATLIYCGCSEVVEWLIPKTFQALHYYLPSGSIGWRKNI